MTSLEDHAKKRLSEAGWVRIQAYAESIAAAAYAGYWLEAADHNWADGRRDEVLRDLQKIADELGLVIAVRDDTAAGNAIGNLSHAMQIADARHAARREAGE